MGRSRHGYGKKYNDYGIGFYCSESIELAKEWACANENDDGFANEYELDLNGLNILNLTDKKYNILNWFAILLENRYFDISSPIAKEAKDYLINNFLPNYKEYDVIIGYRADDSYFSFASAFLNNVITIEQLKRAMELGKLGEQVVLKSEKSFNQIKFVNAHCANRHIYYPMRMKRDNLARENFKLEKSNRSIHGTYMIDILREGWTNDEPRLY